MHLAFAHAFLAAFPERRHLLNLSPASLGVRCRQSLANSTHSPVVATAPTRQFWLGFFAFPDNATHCDMPRGGLRILFDRSAPCLRIGLLHGPRSTQLCEPVLSRNSRLQQAGPTFVERRARTSTPTDCWRMALPGFARNGPPMLSLEK